MTRRGRNLSVKQLESYLQTLDDFEAPKIKLEQYATPPHIAALMLNAIHVTHNDLEDKFVADLGCGTGRLSIGSLMCGASLVIGFDLDADALDCGLANVREIYDEHGEGAYRSCGQINFIRGDLASQDCLWEAFSNKFDTVIMNPPFGTKHNQGLDMLFLRRGINLTNNVVYSLHKSSTRDYIQKSCQELGVEAKPIAQVRYNLENTYKFHRKKSVDIGVDLWRVTKIKN